MMSTIISCALFLLAGGMSPANPLSSIVPSTSLAVTSAPVQVPFPAGFTERPFATADTAQRILGPEHPDTQAAAEALREWKSQ
jgi:hypothetical protein